VTTGMSRIQQGFNGITHEVDESPASTCDPIIHWHSLFPTTDPPVGGEFTHTFETDGLGGQTLVFRAMYVTPGMGHVPATTNGDCTPLVIEVAPIQVCDDTGQLCKSVVIEGESGNGIIAIGEPITYTFVIDVVNNDSEIWLAAIITDDWPGDLAVGDEGEDLTDWDHDQPDNFNFEDNLVCDLDQTGQKNHNEHLTCDVAGDGDLGVDETASVGVTAQTDWNFGQSKKFMRGAGGIGEYTSCGVHSINPGATISYFLDEDDQDVDDPRTLTTPELFVTVYQNNDLSLSDCDGDGVFDDVDNCPFTPNVGQEDNHGTDLGDACEDTDGDTVLDDTDVCPLVEDPNQEDTDTDGVGDACDMCPGSDPDLPVNPWGCNPGIPDD